MIAMSIPREGTAKWEGPVPPFVQYALEHRERGELTPELMRELEGMDIHLSLASVQVEGSPSEERVKKREHGSARTEKGKVQEEATAPATNLAPASKYALSKASLDRFARALEKVRGDRGV